MRLVSLLCALHSVRRPRCGHSHNPAAPRAAPQTRTCRRSAPQRRREQNTGGKRPPSFIRRYAFQTRSAAAASLPPVAPGALGHTRPPLSACTPRGPPGPAAVAARRRAAMRVAHSPQWQIWPFFRQTNHYRGLNLAAPGSGCANNRSRPHSALCFLPAPPCPRSARQPPLSTLQWGV